MKYNFNKNDLLKTLSPICFAEEGKTYFSTWIVISENKHFINSSVNPDESILNNNSSVAFFVSPVEHEKSARDH